MSPDAARDAVAARDTRAVSPAVVALLVLLFVGLTAATWARWGDLRVDTGGAIYQASVLADGGVLYRDTLSHYGPIAPYAVGALFRLFGPHLGVVYGLGLVLLAVESWLLWYVARRFLSQPDAIVGVVAFWVLLGFQPGLFNWVFPNVFATTFGAVFATAAVALVVADVERPRAAKLALASLATAAAGLSKVEQGGAAFGTLAAYAFLLRSGRPGVLRTLGVVVVPGLLLTALVAALVALTVPWREVVFENVYRTRSLGPVLAAYEARVAPPLLATLPRPAFHYLVELPVRVAMVAAGASWLLRPGRWRWAGGAVLLLALGAPFLPGYPANSDFEIGTPHRVPVTQLTWVAVGWAVTAVGALVAWRRDPGWIGSRVVVIVALFSVLDTLRWRFRILWPAYYAVFAPFLLVLIVRTVSQTILGVRSAWAVGLVVSTGLCLSALGGWEGYYAARTFTLRYPRGTIRSRVWDGKPMKRVIDHLRSRTRPGDWVAVIPEEQLINFLAETRHPTRDTGIGPGWLATPADERRFVQEVDQKQTRFVVVSERRYPEFGAGGVATYNPIVMQYLQEHYQPVLRTTFYTVLERVAPEGDGTAARDAAGHPGE